MKGKTGGMSPNEVARKKCRGDLVAIETRRATLEVCRLPYLYEVWGVGRRLVTSESG